MRSRGRILGVLSRVDPARQAGDDQIWPWTTQPPFWASNCAIGATSSRPSRTCRRELVDDLLAGAEESAAYAQAAALGHDLRRTHYRGENP